MPATASTGPVLVNVNAVSSSTSNSFEVPNPVISSIAPPSAPVGGVITVNGSGFGAAGTGGGSSPGQVWLNGVSLPTGAWSDTSISASLPGNVTSGPLTVTKYNATSAGVQFTVEGAPTVTGLSPASGAVGSTVTVSGTGFVSTSIWN